MRRIIFAATLVLSPWALPSPGWGLQLSDLVTNCRTALRDTAADTNFQRFTSAQLTSFVNEGQTLVNNTVEPLTGSVQFDLSAGAAEYPLPADFKTVARVVLSGKRIVGTSYNYLDQNFTNWQTASSTSTLYFIDYYSSATTSLQIGFYANPKFTTTGGSVVLFYYQNPAALINLTDVPFDGRANLYPYHDALTYYCAMRGWAVQNRVDLAKLYSDLFAQDVAAMKNDVNFLPDFSPAVTGYRGPPSQTQ